MVRLQRGAPVDQLLARWRASSDGVHDAFRDGDPHARVDWVAGQLSLRTLTTTRLAETWIHTGDVAGALGVELVPADRLELIARLAWRTLPYAFARSGRTLHGPVTFDLTGVSGDDWLFEGGEPATTVVRGSGVELCAVAARRVAPAETGLSGDGPDVAAVLELVRTYA